MTLDLFSRMIEFQSRMGELRRSVQHARFQASSYSRMKENQSTWLPKISSKAKKILDKFATMSRQQIRRQILADAALSVKDRNPKLNRAERRKLTRAYAAGCWADVRK